MLHFKGFLSRLTCWNVFFSFFFLQIESHGFIFRWLNSFQFYYTCSINFNSFILSNRKYFWYENSQYFDCYLNDKLKRLDWLSMYCRFFSKKYKCKNFNLYMYLVLWIFLYVFLIVIVFKSNLINWNLSMCLKSMENLRFTKIKKRISTHAHTHRQFISRFFQLKYS